MGATLVDYVYLLRPLPPRRDYSLLRQQLLPPLQYSFRLRREQLLPLPLLLLFLLLLRPRRRQHCCQRSKEKSEGAENVLFNVKICRYVWFMFSTFRARDGMGCSSAISHTCVSSPSLAVFTYLSPTLAVFLRSQLSCCRNSFCPGSHRREYSPLPRILSWLLTVKGVPQPTLVPSGVRLHSRAHALLTHNKRVLHGATIMGVCFTPSLVETRIHGQFITWALQDYGLSHTTGLSCDLPVFLPLPRLMYPPPPPEFTSSAAPPARSGFAWPSPERGITCWWSARRACS